MGVGSLAPAGQTYSVSLRPKRNPAPKFKKKKVDNLQRMIAKVSSVLLMHVHIVMYTCAHQHSPHTLIALTCTPSRRKGNKFSKSRNCIVSINIEALVKH